MIFILLIYNLIAITCIVYAVFNYKDVLSWVWVKGKAGFVWLWNWLKGISK